MLFFTGYKLICRCSLPVETVRHILLPPRLSSSSCFLPRLLYINGFLSSLSAYFCFLPRVCPRDSASCRRLSAGISIMRTVSAGSHYARTVGSKGSKRSRTVSAAVKCDGQSQQEAKIDGLFCILCFISDK